MNENPNRPEAERLLGVAEKLLQSRDFNGCRDFAVLAQETEPLLEGSDQILAVADVLLSSEKRINNHHDWYSILQIERRTDDQDLLKKQYRRLALLLHPDKNKFSFADQAFKLVVDAWAVLSDSAKKSLYDNELSLFSRIDLSNSGKLPVRRSQRPAGGKKQSMEAVNTTTTGGDGSERTTTTKLSAFWTACPYCYILYEYPRVYEECCLRCQNCNRAFHAALISSLPPLVPGREAYYCCWGFFPLGFVSGSAENGGEKDTGTDQAEGFPNWMPPIFSPGQQSGGSSSVAATPQPHPPPPPQAPVFSPQNQASHRIPNAGPRPAPPRPVIGLMARGGGSVQVSDANAPGFAPKKRGRPRKVPLQA